MSVRECEGECACVILERMEGCECVCMCGLSVWKKVPNQSITEKKHVLRNPS